MLADSMLSALGFLSVAMLHCCCVLCQDKAEWFELMNGKPVENWCKNCGIACESFPLSSKEDMANKLSDKNDTKTKQARKSAVAVSL